MSSKDDRVVQGQMLVGPEMGPNMIHRLRNPAEIMKQRRSVANYMGEIATAQHPEIEHPEIDLTPDVLEFALYDDFTRPHYTDHTPALVVPAKRRPDKPDNLVDGVLFFFNELEDIPRSIGGLTRTARIKTHNANNLVDKPTRDAKKERAAAHELEGYLPKLVGLERKLEGDLKLARKGRDLFERVPERARFRRRDIVPILRDSEMLIHRSVKLAAEAEGWDSHQAELALQKQLVDGTGKELMDRWSAYLRVVGWYTRDKQAVVRGRVKDASVAIQRHYELAAEYGPDHRTEVVA